MGELRKNVEFLLFIDYLSGRMGTFNDIYNRTREIELPGTFNNTLLPLNNALIFSGKYIGNKIFN